jgi:hypothetical protein
MIFGSVMVLCGKVTSDVTTSICLRSEKKFSQKIIRKKEICVILNSETSQTCLLFGIGSSSPLSSSCTAALPASSLSLDPGGSEGSA